MVLPQRTYFTPDFPAPSFPFSPLVPWGPFNPGLPAEPLSPLGPGGPGKGLLTPGLPASPVSGQKYNVKRLFENVFYRCSSRKSTKSVCAQFLAVKEAKEIKVKYLLPQICQVDRPYQAAQLSQGTQHQIIQGCLVSLVFQVILADLLGHPFHRGRPVL